MKHLRLLIATLLLISATSAQAQTARLYTSADGLANSHIYDIFQDSKGFIWISTENGLSKFDGMKFSTFRYDRLNENTIASNTIRSVHEDSKGRFWVGTSAGLQIFDTEYNTFTKVNLEDWSVPDSDQHIISVMELEIIGKNRILAATSGHGIYILDADDQRIDHDLQNAFNKLLPSKFIENTFLDSKGRLWVTTDLGGLNVFDMKNLTEIKDIWGNGLSRESKDTFNSFTEEAQTGNIYIGSSNFGILVYDEASGKIRKAAGNSGQDYNIMSMTLNNVVPRYGERTYLVGTENNGIKLFNANTESIRDIRISSVPFNTSGWKVQCMEEDSQGNVWVGAIQKGVLIIPKSMFGFRHIDFNKTENGGHGNISVTSVISDEERDCLWVGTDGGGIFQTDRYSTFANITAENSKLSNNSIMSLALDKRGTLWVATYLGGLFSYSPERGVRAFRDQAKLGNEKTYTLAYDQEKDVLYVGTHGNGFSMIDAAGEKLLRTWDEDDEYKWVSYLSLDSSGLLWIGTYNGPMAYDSSTDKLTMYELVKDKSIRVNAIFESRAGDVWLGTGEGLIKMDRATREKTVYTEDKGLASNSVSGILEDNEGNLWISTFNGLSRLDHESGTFKNFYQHDGLQENEFNVRAAYKSANGRMYFGGINGLTAFSPQYVERQKTPVPPLYLSNLSVMNEDIKYDPVKGKDNMLDKHISEATTITLPNHANMFSLEFSVLEYTNPKKISYEYKMEGLERSWNRTLDGSQTATYTNLPCGRYRMKIKAFYEGEPDAFSYKEIGIRILPPWYMTVWAWIVYLTLGFLGILAAIRHRNRKIALKHQQEESQMKEMKLQMFTNISHEIRTPLTLVMNPLKKMREEEHDPRQKELYNLMYRNSLRILRLVNQLLDIRKVDNGQMKMHFLETDVVYFIKDIMQSFENLAVNRGIDFQIEPAGEVINLWIDQGNFDKIIFNILSNAFKFTPDSGSVKISISDPIPNHGVLDSYIENYVEFIIENSGEHIEEKHFEKLFDRFYQVDIRDAKMGSGVGLNLAKLLVDLHHGHISAFNTEAGVAFRIRIPVGCGHLTADEMTKPQNHKDLYTKHPIISDSDYSSVEDVTYSSPVEEGKNTRQSKKKNIVLVDDDSEMRAYLRLELQSIYNVEVCANGKEAWSKISTTIPDAVITDLIMDKMDGAELCDKIKKNPGTNHIPVILLTSSTDEQSHNRCIKSGADRFFTKPISLEILKSALASAIATRETIKNKYTREIDYGYGDIKMNNADNQLATKVIAIIRKNIENTEFSVEELSREVGMSRVHLNRKLKEMMNISPSNLIRSIRLKQAAYLLINNKVNISEVAYKVGFSTHSYFSNSFHDYFGMTPKEFTAQYMNCTDEETLKKFFG